MAAVKFRGVPLVRSIDSGGHRVGVDETSHLKGKPGTSDYLCDRSGRHHAGILFVVVEGNTGADLREWCGEPRGEWLACIAAVSIDLTDSSRSGLSHISTMRPVWRTRSRWSASLTVVSARYAAASKTRPWIIEAVKKTTTTVSKTAVKSLGTARQQRHRPNSPQTASDDHGTGSREPGWPKNPSATSTSWKISRCRRPHRQDHRRCREDDVP